MRVVTFKANAKVVFGAILVITGIIVVVLTFMSNHGIETVDGKIANIESDTDVERANFLKSFGWEFSDKYTQKEVTIPTTFNDVYNEYNEIQKNQGFDLTEFAGKTVKIYTYSITNYKGYEDADYIYANILIFDGKIIGGDVCSTSTDGFMHGFEYEEQ